MQLIRGRLDSFRIATWNIRYDAMPDNIPVGQTLKEIPDPLKEFPFLQTHEERPWSTRRLRVAQKILSLQVALVGIQEAVARQVHDLAVFLGNEWSWVGVGRDDGVVAGEFCPIFYNKTRLKLLSCDSFWLSRTPFKPSRYPDACCNRICTVARFALISDSQTSFSILNAHLDNVSDGQRRLGASMLLMRAKYEAVTAEQPVFVLGDFNSAPFGDGAGAYEIITGAIPPMSIPTSFMDKFQPSPEQEDPWFSMLDLLGSTPRSQVSGNFATFTGFTPPQRTWTWLRIDFILGGSNGRWTSIRHIVDTALNDDGTLSSDHRPVVAEVTLVAK